MERPVLMERLAKRARNLFFLPGGTNDPSRRSSRRDTGEMAVHD
jgi:hypothetical protein